jgi:hypothetical protein
MTGNPAGALPARALGAAAAMAITGLLAAPDARALDEQKGEAQAIEACDKRLCSIVTGKNPAGEDLKCALTKTWSRATIKEGDRSSLTWAFGDARCSVDVDISRAAVVAAMTSSKPHKFWAPPHTANCIVEQDGRPQPLRATLAPKIVFKDGKAEKVWINLKEIDGPAGLRDWLAAAAQLSDSVGIFHQAMVKAVNRYIYRHCPKYFPQAQADKIAPAK